MEPKMKLYLVQDSDRHAYVIAESMNAAIDLWVDQIEKENPDSEDHICAEPEGVALVHDQLIITPSQVFNGIE